MPKSFLVIGRSLLAGSIVAAVALILLPWASGFRAWFGDPDFPAYLTLQWLAALYFSFIITLSSAQLAIHYLGRQAPADRCMALCLAVVSAICGVLHIRIYWEDYRDASAIALICGLIMFAIPTMIQFLQFLLRKAFNR